MPERTAAEVLAEKLKTAWSELVRQPCVTPIAERFDKIAAELADDPAITVRTDMVVERFVVEFRYVKDQWPETGMHSVEQVYAVLTTNGRVLRDAPDHRIIVRPYPENNPS